MQLSVVKVFTAFLILIALGRAQQAVEPMYCLQRTRDRLLADLNRMPRYTCVETIRRIYYDARFGSQGSSCTALVDAHDRGKHRVHAFAWDRLRLEVAWVNNRNVFSWVGMPEFDEGNIEPLAGGGPLSSGDFGILLRDIILHANPAFAREQVVDGRRVFEYSYTMPASQSTYRIRTAGGWTQIGYYGTLLLDPEAMDIVKLRMRAYQVPVNDVTCFAADEIKYTRSFIHGKRVLIPENGRLDLIQLSGTESLNEVTYGNCREYRAAVRLIFDPLTSQASLRPQDGYQTGPLFSVPAGLEFTARIVTPIDSEKTAIGDPVEMVTRTPIYGKDKKLIAPAGVRIHGRWTDFHWQADPISTYTFSLNVEWAEIEGRAIPFHAALEPATPKVFATKIWSREVQQQSPSRWDASFSFARRHLQLTNLDARWITAASPSKGR